MAVFTCWGAECRSHYDMTAIEKGAPNSWKSLCQYGLSDPKLHCKDPNTGGLRGAHPGMVIESSVLAPKVEKKEVCLGF